MNVELSSITAAGVQMINQKKLERRKRRKPSSRDGGSRKQSTSSVSKESVSSASNISRVQPSPQVVSNDSLGKENTDVGERNSAETPVLTPHPASILHHHREPSWVPRDVDKNGGGDGSRSNSSVGHTAHLTPVVSGRVTVAPVTRRMYLQVAILWALMHLTIFYSNSYI